MYSVVRLGDDLIDLLRYLRTVNFNHDAAFCCDHNIQRGKKY